MVATGSEHVNIADVLVYPRHVLPIMKLIIVAVASKSIGSVVTRLSKKTPMELPLITGFLMTGMICGPFVLGLIDKDDVIDLKFTDDVSLSFIAFAAGNEMYMKDMAGKLGKIRKIVTSLILSVFVVGTIVMYALGDWVPFMKDMDSAGRWGQALLSAAILLARSPSSAIAIVNELRAKGPFTQTALGVVMVIDVATIVLFSASAQVARTLTSGDEFSADFIGFIFAQLSISVVVGIVLYGIVNLMFSFTENSSCVNAFLHQMGLKLIDLRAMFTLMIGWSIFLTAQAVQHYSKHHLMEPLLICMIAGFLICNYTKHRVGFAHVLEFAGPEVYTVFFTYTGLSLYLDVFISRIKYAVVIFLVRVTSLIMGTLAGGTWAKDNWEHTKVSWMAYITQAGVGLGLAKQVGAEFGSWGEDFSTTMISVIVMNQILGPPFMKWALKHIGEAYQGGKPNEFEVEIELHDDDDDSDDSMDSMDMDNDATFANLPQKTPYKEGKDVLNDSPTDPFSHPSLNADTGVSSAFANADEEAKKKLQRTERKRRMAEVKRAARMQQLHQLGQMVMVRRHHIEDEQLSLVPWWKEEEANSNAMTDAVDAAYAPTASVQRSQQPNRSLSARMARPAPLTAIMQTGFQVPPSAVQRPRLSPIADTSANSTPQQIAAQDAVNLQQQALALITAINMNTQTLVEANGGQANTAAPSGPMYTAPITRRRNYTPVPVTPRVTLVEGSNTAALGGVASPGGRRQLLLSPRPTGPAPPSGGNGNNNGRPWWPSLFGNSGGNNNGGNRGNGSDVRNLDAFMQEEGNTRGPNGRNTRVQAFSADV
jgi:Kef-type K+ transport system membrane component KefB